MLTISVLLVSALMIIIFTTVNNKLKNMALRNYPSFSVLNELCIMLGG